MIETALDIPGDHPAYAGHFPGQPILPAVVLLAEVLAVTGELSVSSAKFLKPVVPGTPLVLAHEALASGVRFEIRAPGGMVASGTLSKRQAR